MDRLGIRPRSASDDAEEAPRRCAHGLREDRSEARPFLYSTGFGQLGACWNGGWRQGGKDLDL